MKCCGVVLETAIKDGIVYNLYCGDRVYCKKCYDLISERGVEDESSN